jgi:hypothetical protein
MNALQTKIFFSNSRYTNNNNDVISMEDAINKWLVVSHEKINIESKSVKQSGAMYLTVMFWYRNK